MRKVYEIIIVIIFISMFSGHASAGALFIKILVDDPVIKTSPLTIKHIAGALEGRDDFDSEFLDAPSGTASIDFFSAIPLDPYKLRIDSRPLDSLSSIHAKIYGKNLSGSTSAKISFLLWNPGGEDNLANKSIRAFLYDPAGNLLRTYDIKDLASSVDTIPITVWNGHSYNIHVDFALKDNYIPSFFDWEIIILFILLVGIALWLLKKILNRNPIW